MGLFGHKTLKSEKVEIPWVYVYATAEAGRDNAQQWAANVARSFITYFAELESGSLTLWLGNLPGPDSSIMFRPPGGGKFTIAHLPDGPSTMTSTLPEYVAGYAFFFSEVPFLSPVSSTGIKRMLNSLLTAQANTPATAVRIAMQ